MGNPSRPWHGYLRSLDLLTCSFLGERRHRVSYRLLNRTSRCCYCNASSSADSRARCQQWAICGTHAHEGPAEHCKHHCKLWIASLCDRCPSSSGARGFLALSSRNTLALIPSMLHALKQCCAAVSAVCVTGCLQSTTVILKACGTSFLWYTNSSS